MTQAHRQADRQTDRMAKFNSTIKATAWSLTINNPTQADEDNIQEARMKGWKVDGQKEKGEEGTEHYQLMLKTPQTRGSAIKKAFPRAHIEVARNVKALEQYVHKDETRIGEVSGENDKYPSPTKFMGLFADYVGSEFKRVTHKYKKSYDEMDGDELLEVFDDCVNKLIADGYYVEAYGVNPQVRGSIKRYGQSIILRELNKNIKQQDGLEETLEEIDDEEDKEGENV